jgi:Ca2+-dependent lipid-binding protein
VGTQGIHCTKGVPKKSNPEWNELFEIAIPAADTPVNLHVTARDSKRENSVGMALQLNLPLNSVNAEHVWINLDKIVVVGSKTNIFKNAGKVLLQMRFIPRTQPQ